MMNGGVGYHLVCLVATGFGTPSGGRTHVRQAPGTLRGRGTSVFFVLMFYGA